MVAIAIDFKKAYDAIKRETIVQILKELRIDSKIIDFIVRNVKLCKEKCEKISNIEVVEEIKY